MTLKLKIATIYYICCMCYPERNLLFQCNIICYIDIEILNLCICKTLMRKCLYEYKVSWINIEKWIFQYGSQFYWWRKLGYPWKKTRPVARHWQTLSHIVVVRQVGFFFTGTPVSSTNKTDCHTEILLKVTLNTITPNPLILTHDLVFSLVP
jgi:hypothetical protein